MTAVKSTQSLKPTAGTGIGQYSRRCAPSRKAVSLEVLGQSVEAQNE
jgi:hypothetical protein